MGIAYFLWFLLCKMWKANRVPRFLPRIHIPLLMKLYSVRYLETHWGSLFSRSANCRECNHVITDHSHDLCHTHAYCARKGQYHAALCYVCCDLWHRAEDTSDPSDAISAFETLSAWIAGFRKNSKGRRPGQDHFYDPHEKARLSEMHVIIANLKSIPGLDLDQEHVSRPKSRSPRSTPPHSSQCTPPHSQDVLDVEDDDESPPPTPYLATFHFVSSPANSDATSHHSGGEQCDYLFVFFQFFNIVGFFQCFTYFSYVNVLFFIYDFFNAVAVV